MDELRVETIDPQRFEPYGKYLGKPAGVAPTAEREDLRVWLGLSDLLGLDASKTIWGYLEVSRHNLPLNRLERHLRTAEAFIALRGSSVMVVAPPSDPNDPNARPDEQAMRAFLLEGGEGVFFPTGFWHWAPFAVSERASFLLLLQSDVMDDIDLREITPRRIVLY